MGIIVIFGVAAYTPMAQNEKRENIFDLIKSMNKAEKRNFKLFANRLGSGEETKFVTLFDCIDSLDEYDEAKVLQRCVSITKRQLPNMKAHLYRQILVSIRLLEAQRNIDMQIRESLDFARILYNKGQYRQSLKLLDKAKETALYNEMNTNALEIIEFQKTVESMQSSKSMIGNTETNSKESIELCTRITNTNELSILSMML